jgi:flavin-dependent dehydrogenase
LREPEKIFMTGVTRSVDHLVIGGGPAGAMVALRLAAAGRSVTLLEKAPGAHHKVCGGFLSHEAIAYLEHAGISPRQLGAVAVRNVRLSAGNKVVEAPLPFPALSLSRRVLDAALLDRAEELGCRILRGSSADSLAREGCEWRAELNDGSLLRAGAVFLATGKHDLRGFARTRGKQSDLTGFKMHFRLAPAQTASLRDTMDLYLFPGGYGGLSLVEDSIANLCFVVRRRALRSIGGWPLLLALILRSNRHLRRLMEGAAALWPRPLAISPIPYGYRAEEYPDLWRVGDQAAVIPSFTGDGMSIALHSAALAAQMYLAGSGATDYARALRGQLARAMNLAIWLSRAAVTRPGRTAALTAFRLAPGVMRWVAESTRIPQSSIVDDDDLLLGAGAAARQSA